MINEVTVFNIREYLSYADVNNLGEEELRQILSEFFCDKNLDVERFLKEQAIEFTKKNQSVTYLVFSNDDAQLGKNYNAGANERITGEQLLQAAVDTIKELQYMVGGMVVFLEAEDKDKLLYFYQQENGFKKFDVRQTNSRKEDSHSLVQLLKVL